MLSQVGNFLDILLDFFRDVRKSSGNHLGGPNKHKYAVFDKKHLKLLIFSFFHFFDFFVKKQSVFQ